MLSDPPLSHLQAGVSQADSISRQSMTGIYDIRLGFFCNAADLYENSPLYIRFFQKISTNSGCYYEQYGDEFYDQ